MKKLRIPAGLYDALPYFYVCAGLLALSVLRNELAVFMGLVLLAAGGVLGFLRYQYRRGLHQGASGVSEPKATEAETPAGGLVHIAWRNAFNCGHPVIDEQRHRLFSLGSDLINAVLMKQSRAQVERLIDELIERIIDHFRTRESVLAETNPPFLKKHREIHRALLARAANVRDEFLNGEIASSQLAGFICCEVIADYLIGDAAELAVAAKGWPVGSSSQSASNPEGARGSAEETGQPA